MADKMFEAAEQKKRIQLCKKEQMNFAFCPGKKPDGHKFALDKNKAPKILEKICLLEGETKATSFGLAEVVEDELLLRCEKLAAGLKKGVLFSLKQVKQTMPVRIFDPDGNELLEDGEAEPGAATAKSGSPDATDDGIAAGQTAGTSGDKARWAKVLADVMGRVKAAREAGIELPSPVGQLLKAAQALAEKDRFDEAIAQAAKVRDMIESAGRAAPPAPPPPPAAEQRPDPGDADERASLLDALAALQGRVSNAAGTSPPHKDSLTKLSDLIRQQGEKGSLATAQAQLEKLGKLLDHIEKQDLSDDTELRRAAVRGREIWTAAKDQADSGINKLLAALRQRNDRTFAEIGTKLESLAASGLPGVSQGAQSQLLTALLDLEGGGADPAKARQRALRAVEAYGAALQGNEFIDLCDDNPFEIKVSINATMTQALGEISAALQGS